MSILRLESLTVRIGGHTVCQNLNLQVESQQIIGILGRNGVGKTTLLYTIMGFHTPDTGKVLLLETPVHDTPRKELAQKLGILFQENNSDMPSTVLETALLGRHPHNQNLLWDQPADVEITRNALNQLGLTEFENRQVSTLSGGEKQRLAIALLVVQAPQLYLLDEPSNHLDVDYQIKTLELLKAKLKQHTSAMILASHDINLAARFCDQIILLMENGEFIFGESAEVLNEENLTRAYNCQIRAVNVDNKRYFFPA